MPVSKTAHKATANFPKRQKALTAFLLLAAVGFCARESIMTVLLKRWSRKIRQLGRLECCLVYTPCRVFQPNFGMCMCALGSRSFNNFCLICTVVGIVAALFRLLLGRLAQIPMGCRSRRKVRPSSHASLLLLVDREPFLFV
jgi:hypothetical protein